MPYYVYVIECVDGTFYTGYTKDLDARLRLHMNGKGARYTRMHKPLKLVYAEELDSRLDAVRKERKLKKLRHHQKLELINPRTQSRRGHKRTHRNAA